MDKGEKDTVVDNENTNADEQIKKIIKKIEAPNILVIGRTGVGKSTLINSVFGIDLAKTGAGLSITKEFTRYSKPVDEGIPIVLYDSAGYEAEKEKSFVENTELFLENLKAKGLEKQIHLAWYVVHAALGRFEYFDKKIIDKLNAQEIPVIIVLSQCDRASDQEIEGIEQVIKKFEFKKALSILKIAASPLLVRGEPICDAFGLDELVHKTSELLPQIYVDAFVISQAVSIKAKEKLALTYVITAASVCFTSGAIPIPGTTAATAFGSQVALCFLIASVFDYGNLAKFLAYNSFTNASWTALFSTAVLESFILLFPPSAFFSGAAAATYITIIGLAYMSTFEMLAKSHLYENSTKEKVEQFLKKTFKEEFKKYSKIKINSPKDLERVRDEVLNPSD